MITDASVKVQDIFSTLGKEGTFARLLAKMIQKFLI